MAKKLKVGDVVGHFTVTKVFGPGMMAISYRAQSPSGEPVFLKQYKSPSPTVVWYKPFVAYQHELARRVSSGRAQHFAVRHIESFEADWGGRSYFQAYEFVERGADLEQLLEEDRRVRAGAGLTAEQWGRHVTWSKVLTAGVEALHTSGVVHADLKPANAYMISDPSIAAGYQLKLIDMDFSLFADQRAPWHGFQGYVGTDNYRSPEHLRRGDVPSTASDVFTLALILYELLTGRHPYWFDDQAEYARAVNAYTAKPPALLGALPGADSAAFSATLHRCLAPDPSKRPRAVELREGLRGQAGTAPPVAAAPPAQATKREGPAIKAPSLSVSASGRSMTLRVSTELGRAIVQQLGVDEQFWDARQCIVEKSPGGGWTLKPYPGTTNETLLNGAAISQPRALREGDEIAVGRQERGVVKSSIIVQGSRA
ncbi:MAG TPA: protein kinase [Beijerinckiaceae bacterium]|jgi:serine/threonine protein kinase